MIEKIVKIKSIGRFRDYSANGDVSLRKLSLVYAENGRGKTTLCAILRSLQTGRHEFISERKSLAATEPASVHLRIDGASCRFINDAWTATHSDIVIFDPVFVNSNVCSGDYVDHEHKKNLYRVIVGSEGVRLAGQIEEFDRQIRDANVDLRTRRDSISRFMPTGTNLEDYLRWQSVTDIENQIKQKTEQLISRQHIITKYSEIQSKSLLAKVSLPAIPSDFEIILGKQLEDVVTDAEARVRHQISKHEMAHQGEPWLSHGLGYVRENLCPFCGQSLDANELMQAYRSHFSTAYGSLKQEVARLSQHVDTAIGEASLLSTQQTISDNAALAEFWKQFFEVSLPALSFGYIQQRFSSLREQCLLLAKRKEDSPTAPITANEEYSRALTAIQ
ncbi:MAG: AAA family ATPase, partial [Candidatus Thorarchaeota archaeon]